MVMGGMFSWYSGMQTERTEGRDIVSAVVNICATESDMLNHLNCAQGGTLHRNAIFVVRSVRHC
jgi:hypothetical protein